MISVNHYTCLIIIMTHCVIVVLLVQKKVSICHNQIIYRIDELARGPITENGIEPAVRCELHTPYTSGEGYSTDKFCPFPSTCW